MKNKALRFASVCLGIATSAFLVACDPFQEDVIPKEKLVTVNTSATEYYILPNSSAVIDLKAIVISSFENINMRVSQNPGRGTLTAFDDFLLKYTPSAAFTEEVDIYGGDGRDQFKVAFTRNEKILATETITVQMKRYTGEFPCSLIAIEDEVQTAPATPVSTRILFNDRLCGINVKDVLTTISVNPKHGQAIVKSDSIIYTPGADFEGIDEFVYKTSAGNQQRTSGSDGLMVSYGLVKVNVRE